MARKRHKPVNRIKIPVFMTKRFDDEADGVVREFYLSNYIGLPFMVLDCGHGPETLPDQMKRVARYLGLKVEQIEWQGRGPGHRPVNIPKTNPTGEDNATGILR